MKNNTDKETENTKIGLTFPLTKHVLTSWHTYAWITAQCLIIAACSLFQVNELLQVLISILFATTITTLVIVFLEDLTSEHNVVKPFDYFENTSCKETDEIVKKPECEPKEQTSKEDSHDRT